MSPEAKKVLSGVLVAAATAAIGALQTYVVRLSPGIIAVVAPVLVGLAHYVNALGHAERVDTLAEHKALAMVTDVVNQEVH
jgi:hypothetical protein